MPTLATKNKNIVYASPYVANGKTYRGRLPNGKVGMNQTENRECIKLLKKGFAIKVVAEATGLTHSQVMRRAQIANVSVRDYRNGASEQAQVVIKKHKVEYRS